MYDFRKATREDEYALHEAISRNRRHLISRGNSENVKRDVATLQKICHKGFPIKNTPACAMASCVVNLLTEITEKRVNLKENQKIMFEFLLACIATGPSSSHCAEIIPSVLQMKGVGSYVEKLRGPELTRLFDTIKNVEFTPEQPTLKINYQATHWGDCMLHSLISTAVDPEGKERLRDPSVHTQIVDLHTSFLRLMGEMPKRFAGDVKRVLRGIEKWYDADGNMLEVKKKGKGKEKTSLRSKDTVQRQFEGLQKVVLSEKFGSNKEQLERTIDEIEKTLRAIRESSEIMEFWESLLQFMKELALSQKCAQYPDVIKPFKYFFGNMEEKKLKKNPELVTTWIPVFCEMLLKSPSAKCLESWAFHTAIKMAEFWVPQKELILSWLTIVKGLVQYAEPDAGRAANYILNNDKFKAIWDWKQNERHAIEIVGIIGKIDFPTEKSIKKEKKKKDSDTDDSDESSDDEDDAKLYDEIWERSGDCISTLQNQLKLDDKLGPTVIELIIRTTVSIPQQIC